MIKSSTLRLIFCLLVCMAGGALSGYATANAIDTWYVYLNKPSWNPPNWVFAPVWTLLYLMMAVAWWILIESPNHQKRRPIVAFGLQLFLNFWWSPLFFTMHAVGAALIEIIVMWGAILATIILAYPVERRAAYLLIPYLLWVSFAMALNAAIFYLN